MNPNNSNTARIITVLAVVIVAAGVLTYALLGRKATTPTDTQNSLTSTSTPSTSASGPVATGSTSPNTSGQLYKDGTYTATGSYISPGGDEKLGVTLTLKDDIITAASVTPEPVSPNGKVFQGIFQQNFQPLVVGMNISTVHLTKVSGSSLTGGGFDDALTQIEAEAKN